MMNDLFGKSYLVLYIDFIYHVFCINIVDSVIQSSFGPTPSDSGEYSIGPGRRKQSDFSVHPIGSDLVRITWEENSEGN
jgi:hypothetical protein